MKRISRKRERFQQSLHGLLKWVLNPKKAYLEYERSCEPYLNTQLIKLTADGYANFENPQLKTDQVSLIISPIIWNQYTRQDTTFLKPLHELYAFVQDEFWDYISYFFLHGSFATRDYIKGWSDVDTFVILKKSTVTDSRKLRDFRKLALEADHFLAEIDPIKHHGLLYCTDLDLEWYPSNFMPVAVLKQSVSFTPRPVTITLHCRDARVDVKESFIERSQLFYRAAKTGIFKHHMYNGKYLLDSIDKNQDAMYQLKYFLGLIMTLPAYFCEAIGHPCYKADSFQIINDLISKDALEILDCASRIRSDWEKNESHPFRGGNQVPDWVKADLGSNYFGRAIIYLNELIKYIETQKSLL